MSLGPGLQNAFEFGRTAGARSRSAGTDETKATTKATAPHVCRANRMPLVAVGGDAAWFGFQLMCAKRRFYVPLARRATRFSLAMHLSGCQDV